MEGPAFESGSPLVKEEDGVKTKTQADKAGISTGLWIYRCYATY